MTLRGDRAEISVTVRDSSGEPIRSAGNAKLYRDGMLTDQTALSHGRAFFLCRLLGNYTLVVDASGYKPGQREISVPVAVKYEVDVNLQRELAANEVSGVPGKPLLAPKAKEALDKALQALSANKLSDAEKEVAEAIKLAPTHPDVLYVQGLLFLGRHDWVQAQTVLQKADQLDPNNAHISSALGMALTDQGKYGEAIVPLEKSLQLEPVGWETHWALARAYYHRQQYDGAVKESQEAFTESHGSASQVQLLLAQSLTAVGKYEDAAQTLRDFLKNHPDASGADTARRWLARLAADGKIR